MSVNGENNENGERDNLVDEILEQAEQEVISYLPECDEAELRALCQEIGVEIPVEKDNRKKIFRFVMNYLFQMEGEDDDGGRAKYLQIHGFFRARRMLEAAPIPEIPAQLQQMQQQVINEPIPTPQRPLLPRDGTRRLPLPPADYKPVPQRVYPISPVQVTVGEERKPANLYHLKECKIRGTIGSPGERDKLDYDELLSQITEKEIEGYDQHRIVGAVINAVAPGNVFKKRLVMRRNLEGVSLATLKAMLRTHFKQQESQHILAELTEAVQGHEDTAEEYCTKLMVIRDRAMSRSIEEGCPLEAKYLHKKFLRSFSTGLRNGNVRNELREILKSLPDDDELQECIGEAVRGETERQTKMTNSKIAEVSAVGRGEKNDFQTTLKRGEMEKKKERVDESTRSMMEELKLKHTNEIGSLRAELNEVKSVIKSGFSNLANLAGPPQGPVHQPSSVVYYDPSSVNQFQPPTFTQFNQPPPPTNFISSNQSDPSNTTTIASVQSQPAAIQPSNFSQPLVQQSAHYVPPPLRNLQSQPPSYTSQPPSLPPLQSNNNRRFSGCHACVAQNNRWCNHCLLCGSEDHRVNVCPRRNNRPPPAPQHVVTPPGPSANVSALQGNE